MKGPKHVNPPISLTLSVLSAHRKVIFEKQWFFLDGAVGHFYSTTFEIVSGALQLQKLKNTDSFTGVCFHVSTHTPDTSCVSSWDLDLWCISFLFPDCMQWASNRLLTAWCAFIFTLSHLSTSLSFPRCKRSGHRQQKHCRRWQIPETDQGWHRGPQRERSGGSGTDVTLQLQSHMGKYRSSARCWVCLWERNIGSILWLIVYHPVPCKSNNA